MKKLPVASVVAALLVGSVLLVWFQTSRMSGDMGDENNVSSQVPVGGVIATYKKVPAYQNGTKVTRSHGRHYAEDGYYYGQKWQCVEYVKRFYHDALGHSMPSVWGHARDFFDPEVEHGHINPARGLVQYLNGGDTAPKPDDLLVFRAGSLGHVAIVTRVTSDEVEVIQQNVHGSPRSVHTLTRKNGHWTVGSSKNPAGWLRIPPATAQSSVE